MVFTNGMPILECSLVSVQSLSMGRTLRDITKWEKVNNNVLYESFINYLGQDNLICSDSHTKQNKTPHMSHWKDTQETNKNGWRSGERDGRKQGRSDTPHWVSLILFVFELCEFSVYKGK